MLGDRNTASGNDDRHGGGNVDAVRPVSAGATDVDRAESEPSVAFEVNAQGFMMTEIAPGYDPTEIQSLTAAPISIASDLREFQTIR